MLTNINLALGIAGAALGFLGLILALFAIRDARRWRARCVTVEAGLATIRHEVERVGAAPSPERLEGEFSLLADRLNRLEIRGPQSLDQAIGSARLGATPATLAQQFGLSPIEAELLTRIHGRRSSGRSSPAS